jgi:hypothetical protein
VTSIGEVAAEVHKIVEDLPDLGRWPDELVDRYAAELHRIAQEREADDVPDQINNALRLVMKAADEVREALAYLNAAKGTAQLWREIVLGWNGAPPWMARPQRLPISGRAGQVEGKAAGKRSDPEVVCTVGRYARQSVPAETKSQKFTLEERRRINQLGEVFGCHTCGSMESGTKSGNFVPDHQPISSWVPDGTPQRLYPHCLRCSREQAGWARQLAPVMRKLYEISRRTL